MMFVSRSASRRKRRRLPKENRRKRVSRPSPIWITLFLTAFLAGMALSLDRFAPNVVAEPSALPAIVQSPSQEQVVPVKSSPLDQPLQLLLKGSQTYQKVKDYICTMIKQERINGKLQDPHVILLKFRNQPFSVYMQWQAPKKMAGQQVAYVHGQNKNMMRVRMPGLIGKLGFISISPNDPRATKHSRHSITETGVAHVIARCYNDWKKERELNVHKVDIAEYNYNKRPCTRIEVTRLKKSADSYCYRTVLYLDKQTHLPVRVDCYDWPEQGGPSGGELLEVCSYVDMRFNVGLTGKDFDY